jgi:hypothetical protein
MVLSRRIERCRRTEEHSSVPTTCINNLLIHNMERLDRNECIVELHEVYTSRLWDMSDGQLEEEYTKYLLGKPPYYTPETNGN